MFVLLSQSEGGCNFFRWKDPEICERAKQIILGLIKRKNKLESDIGALRVRVLKLQVALLVCVLIIVAMVVIF